MSDSPASPLSRRARIVIGAAALLIGLPVLFVLFSFISILGVPGTGGETDRYRTSFEVAVDDNGEIVRNTVFGECSHHHGGGWNTGTYSSAAHNGDAPFVVLRDRSLLMLRDLARCLPSGGERGEYSFDAGQPTTSTRGRIALPYSHAWHFDNIDEPKLLRIYLQQPLFRDGIDGRRVVDTKLSFAGRKLDEPMPFVEDSFPWLKTIPWHPVGHQDYGKPLHLSTFSGFEVKLYQVDERFRCEKFDREAEGPILVTGTVWEDCPPWGGGDLGFLTAEPSANLGRIDYAYDRRSPHLVGTLYRATWLRANGAPGVQDDNDFYWQPQLCFDGFCVSTHAARRVVWEGFRIYYPKKNQVISARWKSWAVSDTFRLRERPFRTGP